MSINLVAFKSLVLVTFKSRYGRYMSTFKALCAPAAASAAAVVHSLGAASHLRWEEENEALANCSRHLGVESKAQTLRH